MSKSPCYRVSHWERFQHYKERRPPWVKLHRTLLDDYDFIKAPIVSRSLAPLIWLLASESQDGTIPGHAEISFRLRLPEQEIIEGLNGLESIGYIVKIGDASNVLASDKQQTRIETETEAERETETDSPIAVGKKLIELEKSKEWIEAQGVSLTGKNEFGYDVRKYSAYANIAAIVHFRTGDGLLDHAEFFAIIDSHINPENELVYYINRKGGLMRYMESRLMTEKESRFSQYGIIRVIDFIVSDFISAKKRRPK